MIDDIGLGGAIANIIYLILIITAIGGSLIALFVKKRFFALVWSSLVLNICLYLASLGMLGASGVILRIIAIIIWPILNIFLLYKYFSSKKK